MTTIDLNCDLGEKAGRDAELMPLITSANVACGGHAGDAATMRATVELAKAHGVAVGAHPGFEDRANFGRRELALAPESVFALVKRQVEALAEIAVAAGVKLAHVKPHGGLYNVAARQAATAGAVAEAVRAVDGGLVLFGLAGSELVRAGRAAGLRVAEEVYADRAYGANGLLVPRSQPGAVHESEGAMIAQVLDMVKRGMVRASDGSEVAVQADTLCLHGDGVHAVAFARRIRGALAGAKIPVKRFAA